MNEKDINFEECKQRIIAIQEYFLRDSTPNAKMLLSCLSTGKMLRSKLILYIAGVSEVSLRLCAIVEFIQSASLLHDDVIDEASLRRNKPTIGATFGVNNAIMLGDLLYSVAFYELGAFDKSIARSISKSVALLSLGEIDDVFMTKAFNSDEGTYLKICENKTASLIGASAESAAILAGLDSSVFYEYGINLGIAFQIIDDILDITQDSAKLGKNAMNDFAEGKSTLPYIYAFNRVSEIERNFIKKCFGKRLDEEKVGELKAILIKSGAIEDAIKKARTYGQKALDSIEAFHNVMCMQLVQSMIEREF